MYAYFSGSYEGEQKLAAKLAKKYGDTVRLLLAESVDEKKIKADAIAAAAAAAAQRAHNLREESWFALRPEEQTSGVVDFTSPQFDPRAALKAPQERIVQANPWVANCPILNYTDQAKSILPLDDPLYLEPRIHNNNTKKKKDAQPENQSRKLGPFATIAEQCKKGPFEFLHRLFQKRQRVRILIRYVNGIRGTLTGYILAYDKHFNMILSDVDEVYCPRSTITPFKQKEDAILSSDTPTEGAASAVEIPSNLEVEMDRRTRALQQTTTASSRSKTGDGRSGSFSSTTTNNHGWQVRQRHFKQLLVRGDNVVTVYKAESERSAWPRTHMSPTASVHGRKPVEVPPEQRVGTPGSLIYSLQHKQRQKQKKRMSGGGGPRYDYRSSPR